MGNSTLKDRFFHHHSYISNRNSLLSIILLVLCSCYHSSPSPTPIEIFDTPINTNNQITHQASSSQKTREPTSTISIIQPQSTFTSSPYTPMYQVIQRNNVVSMVPILLVNFDSWSPILALSWSSSGETLAVSAAENIIIYQGQILTETMKISTGAWLTSLNFDPLNRWLTASSQDGLVRFWKLPNFSSDDVFTPLIAHKKAVNQVIYNPDGDLLATAANDGIARIWQIETGERLNDLIGGGYAIPSIAFVDQGKSLAIVNNTTIRIRDIISTRFVKTLRSSTPLHTIAISPDGSKLAGGSLENIIQVWDLDTETEFFTISGHQGKKGQTSALVWNVTYSSNGLLMASGGGDATVRIWNSSNGLELVKLTAHSAAVTCVSFSPDGKYLASGGMDARLIIWGIHQVD